MICEKAAARAARLMQGAVLYFGAAYARFLTAGSPGGWLGSASPGGFS